VLSRIVGGRDLADNWALFIRQSLHFVEILLFGLAVLSVCAAAGFARHYRKAMVPAPAARRWWLGSRAPVAPGVRAGWTSFVFLNLVFGLTQPLIACGLFIRAYVLRAMFLRRGRQQP
jgi:hypothetical protein